MILDVFYKNISKKCAFAENKEEVFFSLKDILKKKKHIIWIVKKVSALEDNISVENDVNIFYFIVLAAA